MRKVCVLEQPAIKVLPLSLAKGELGHHYRFGWLEGTMANRKRDAGREALEKKGWWRSHRWLVLRRLCQFFVLGMF